MSDEHAHEPSEITYAEYFHPARPRSLRYRTRVKQLVRAALGQDRRPAERHEPGLCVVAAEPVDARRRQRDQPAVLRPGHMWQNPFANPDPRHAVESASVWFTAYPISLITRPGESFLAALGDEEHVEGVRHDRHQRASTPARSSARAGSSGWQPTPSVDGHFDRISTEIDPAFGTEAEFRAMCGMATWYGGTIIDDVVPGHTGKGADFRLAEMKYADYPGIYHMVEIDPEDWNLLPDVPPGRDSVNIDAATEEWLQKAGYIIGRLQRVIFYAEGVKETNWSATRAGRRHRRRRAPLGLPALLQGGPAVDQLAGPVVRRHAAGDRRRPALAGRPRLRRRCAWTPTASSASRRAPEGIPAWSEGHPLSEAANHLIAQHGAQGRRLHLPGAEPDHRRHPRHRRGRRRPVLRLRQPARLPARAGHRATPSSCG